MEEWIKRESAYDGLILKVDRGQVRLDDGMEAYREMVDHGGGVGVVPFDGERVYLVRQYRICVDEYMIEIPAGRLEPGEDPAQAAARELEEEIGYRADTLIPAGAYYVSPGFTNSCDRLFLALELTRTQQDLDHDERVEIVPMPLAEVKEKLHAHAFTDAKTALGLRALLEHLDGRANA
jgi:ADP-ribose pyrophosphatase